MKKAADLLFVVFIATVAPFVAGYLTNLFSPWISSADPRGYFLWISVHHVFQMLLGMLLLKVVFRTKLRDCGFNMDNRDIGMPILKRFFVIWTLIVLGFFVVCIVFVPSFPGYIATLYPLDVRFMISKYAVEVLLIIALGEEPIFRAFTGMVLAQTWKEEVKIGKKRISLAVIISAVIFMLSHVNFSLVPFKIIHIDGVKLLLNLVFGLFLAVVFEKTKSLFYTTIAHAWSNVLIYTLGFMTTALFV